MTTDYPPLGFHFAVAFEGIAAARDLRFQQVSGLTATVETESIPEGGENRFAHRLPTGVSFSDLELKRGLVTDSMLIDWCRKAIEEFQFSPKDMLITLLDETHLPVSAWQVNQAIPVQWTVSDFDAQQSQIVIESLRLQYQYFKKAII